MKKLILTLSIALASYFSSFAQWTLPGTDISNTNSGNVGIGTTIPNAKLEVNQSATGSDANILQITNSGTNSASQSANLTFSTGTTGSGYLRVNSSGGAQTVGTSSDMILMNTYTAYANTGSLIFGTQNTRRMMIDPNGNVGIGTTTPGAPVHVVKNSSGYSGIFYNTSATGEGVTIRAGSTSSQNALVVQPYDGSSSLFTVRSDGNVGVGTTSPDEKLTVKGKIHSSEVIVDPITSIPDYVFEPDYKLKSLEEIKSYVDKNHHLPEIPSAKEIEKNGIHMGDMSLKLLKTIEELTLHVIELNKQVKAQSEKITSLENQLKK
jgi:hypothetical protein